MQRGEATVFTYVYTRAAARSFLSQAEDKEQNTIYNCMACIVFCAFTLEAYLNHLGEKKIPNWHVENLERKWDRLKKLKKICKAVDFPLDRGKPPFNSFKKIFAFRDLFAHGKTKVIRMPDAPFSKGLMTPLPKTEWEETVTVQNTRQFLEDTEDMIQAIRAHIGDTSIEFFKFGVF